MSRETMEAFAVVRPERKGRAARPGWTVVGLGLDSCTAWSDAAFGHSLGGRPWLDGPELQRRNPTWQALKVQVTVTYEVPK